MILPTMLEQMKFAIKETTAFVAHSFSDDDRELVDLIITFLTKLGLRCETGKRPEPKGISDKVLERIRAAEVVVAIFTRRNKTADGNYSTSAWTIEEKAAAIAEGKKLLLFVEDRISEFGGLQGDYEYVPFERDNLAPALVQAMDYVLAITSVPLHCRLEGPGKLHFHFGKTQDPKEQIEELRKIVKQQPDNVPVRIGYGRALAQTGDVPAAIEQFTKLSREYPHVADVHHELAHAHQRSENFPTALLSFQKALDLNTSDHKNYRCYGKCLHLHAGTVEDPVVRKSTLEKAKRMLERASVLAPLNCKAPIDGDLFVVNEALSEFKAGERDTKQAVRP